MGQPVVTPRLFLHSNVKSNRIKRFSRDFYRRKKTSINNRIPMEFSSNRLTLCFDMRSTNFSVSLFQMATCKGNSRSIFISKSSVRLHYQYLREVLFFCISSFYSRNKLYKKKQKKNICGMCQHIYENSDEQEKKTIHQTNFKTQTKMYNE